MNKWIKVGALITVPIASITPIFYKINDNEFNYYDQYTHPKDLVYSTNINHINVIEVFTDGLDSTQFTERAKAEETLKDMTIYNNFYNISGSTSFSPTVFWGGDKYNPFQVSKDLNIPISAVGEETYKHSWYKAYMDHIGMNRNYFKDISVLNPIDLCYVEQSNWNASWVGDAVRLKHDGINVASWKDVMTASKDGEFPDSAAYSWLEKHSSAARKDIKGARVQINDLLTHGPRRISTHKLSASLEESYQEVIKKYKQLVNTLKNIKDQNNRSAYDNSLIIFYGDHSDHGLQPDKPAVDSSNSVLMIKYPDVHNEHIDIDNDRVVQAVYLNDIINDCIVHNNKNYIKTNSKFNHDVTFPVYNVTKLMTARANSHQQAELVSSIDVHYNEIGSHIADIQRFEAYHA